jgi:2-dehydropantoate 2-reductase
MRYLVIGSGAVGGYIGGRLALSGQPVMFLDRPPIVEILSKNGLQLQQDGDDFILRDPKTATSLSEAIAKQVPEVILLCVKAYHCEAAAKELASASDLSAPVVCVLNGIGNEETLAIEIGEARVIPASLTSAIGIIETGHIRVERLRGLGIAATHPLSSTISDEMNNAELNPVLFTDAERMKWSKVLTNIISNATSAILNWVPDLVFNHRGLYRLEIEALRETVRVMRALGLPPQDLPGVPVRLLARAIFLPPALTMPLFKKAAISGRGEKLPSFCYDVGRGKSEAPWLNGAIADHGRQMGIRTPANDVLVKVLMGLVDGRLEPASFHGNAELLLSKAQAAGVPGIRGYNQPRRPEISD